MLRSMALIEVYSVAYHSFVYKFDKDSIEENRNLSSRVIPINAILTILTLADMIQITMRRTGEESMNKISK